MIMLTLSNLELSKSSVCVSVFEKVENFSIYPEKPLEALDGLSARAPLT